MSENTAETKSECSREQVNCFCMGAGPEMFALFKKLGPDSARQHFRNARVEVLKGMRELIENRIEELTKEEEKKGTKVAVE